MNGSFPSISSSSSPSSPSSSSSSASDVLMSFLLSLPASSFAALASSLASDLRLLRSRLALLLLSPAHFSRALSRLRSLSLPLKSLLLARLLLRSLRLLLSSSVSATSSHPHRLRLLDLDAALLLMAMCDSYRPHHPHPHPVDWRSTVAAHALSSALSPAALGDTPWAVLGPYVDLAAKCPRFLEVAGNGDGGGKMWGGARAAVAAVVALPSVEYSGGEEGDGGSRECAVCREGMAAGRQVCELPCGHRFHWGCTLAWLRKRNTCPCCRFELPTEDVFAEIGRLWRAVVRIGGGGGDGTSWGGAGRASRGG